VKRRRIAQTSPTEFKLSRGGGGTFPTRKFAFLQRGRGNWFQVYNRVKKVFKY